MYDDPIKRQVCPAALIASLPLKSPGAAGRPTIIIAAPWFGNPSLISGRWRTGAVIYAGRRMSLAGLLESLY